MVAIAGMLALPAGWLQVAVPQRLVPVLPAAQPWVVIQPPVVLAAAVVPEKLGLAFSSPAG